MVATEHNGTVELTTATVECHSLDALGRAICGMSLAGVRGDHALGDCAIDRHPRCGACDSLMFIDGDQPGLLEGA